MASKALARLGDLTTHGAPIISSGQDGTVFCEGKEVAVEGAVIATHENDPTHALPYLDTNLSSSIFINGKPIALHGSIANNSNCGASVIASATKTFGD